MAFLREEIDAAEGRASDLLLDRPLTSLLDIWYTYGVLYLMGVPIESGEYQQYLTPGASADWLDDDDVAVVAAKLDATDPENPELDGVRVKTTYTEDILQQVAHSKNPDSNGQDYSITHQGAKGGKSPEYIGGSYLPNIFARWADSEPVDEVVESHEDGEILKAITTIADDADELAGLESAVTSKLDTEEAYKCLATVVVKTEPDGEYRWPADVDVLNEAMRQRKLFKYKEKNDAFSAGEGTCCITGEEGTLVGAVSDPFNAFVTKQREVFSSLNGDDAYLSRPVSEDAAAVLEQANAFVNACRTSIGSKLFLYTLPFFETVDDETAPALYAVLRSLVEEDRGDALAWTLRKYDDLSDVYDRAPKMYAAIVHEEHNNTWHVFGESFGTDLYAVRRATDAHVTALDSWLVGDAVTAAIEERVPEENEDVGRPDADVLAAWEDDNDARSLVFPNRSSVEYKVANLEYGSRTLPTSHSADPTPDDPRIKLLNALLGGERLTVQWLIQQYVHTLVELRGYHFSETSLVEEQSIQMDVLAARGALRSHRSDDSITTVPPYMTDDLTPTTVEPDEPNEPESYAMYENPVDAVARHMDDPGGIDFRTAKLVAFLAQKPPLRDDERRAAFLLGVLVGRLSRYQSSRRNMNETLASGYSIDGITKNRLQRLYPTLIDKAEGYSTADDHPGGILYKETTTRVSDALADNPPEEWSLRNYQVKYWYALGVQYGLTDDSARRASTTDDAADESAADEADTAEVA